MKVTSFWHYIALKPTFRPNMDSRPNGKRSPTHLKTLFDEGHEGQNTSCIANNNALLWGSHVRCQNIRRLSIKKQFTLFCLWHITSNLFKLGSVRKNKIILQMITKPHADGRITPRWREVEAVKQADTLSVLVEMGVWLTVHLRLADVWLSGIWLY